MADPADPADLVLAPAARLLWRGPDTIQLALGSDAVVVDGLPMPTIRAIATRADPPPSAGPVTTTPDVRAALATLLDAGYLWHRRPPADDARRTPPTPRLAGELRALQVRHGERAGQVLAARRYACVEVEGAHRLATHIAAVLAAAGVQRVRCTSADRVSLGDAVPGGLAPDDEGRLRHTAADAALRRAAPDVDTTPLQVAPDLTILTLHAPLPDARRDALHADGRAYLTVGLNLDRGVIGPLVVPGLTSCARCADLARTERDRAWNALAVQLAVPPRHGFSSPVALATVVAGVAAQQALAFLDGEEPATVDGTLEITEPDWRLRRRSWAVHPTCDCTPTEDT